jgi:exodeoxyribonuclease V beta subunit
MFRDWHQMWSGRGFMVMAQSLLASRKVRGRLLRFPDGERRLTNLLHCLELIHRHEHEQKPGIEGLVAWFAERLSAQDDNEEYQIRLETDEKAIRVATVHVSKGLEYPIVFCPFMWEGVKDGAESAASCSQSEASCSQIAAFHDGFRRVKDFGSSSYQDARMAAQRESLAESLRLLYVAMTRAKYRCYLTAGKVAGSNRGKSRPENSALAWLFHASEETRAAANVVGELVRKISLLSAETMQEQLASIQERANGTISVAVLPERTPSFYAAPGGGGGALAARRFSGTVVGDWRVTSFTAFAAHESAAVELPDRDGEGAAEKTPEAAPGEGAGGKTIFSFPRGAQAGIFFHEIFEELDFAGATAEAIHRLVGSKLEKYGYEKEWIEPLGGVIGDVIHTPLAARDGAFTLSGIRPGAWATEMEFYFPLKWITSGLMGECLKRWDSRFDVADISRVAAALDFRPVRGMVRGFMDMVFEHAGKYYLVDWKSNHLGDRVEDYGPEALRTAMERNLYPLQYLIYTVALNRHLTRRVRGYDYASSFGGVIYAFIRGASAKKGETYGFFRDVPPAGMIADLTGALIEEDKRSAHEKGRP